MKKSTFAIAAVAVIMVAAGASFVTGSIIHHYVNQPGQLSHMSWKDVYRDPVDAVQDVDVIVHARLAGTSPGRVAYSSDPSDYVPFELNHFIVEETLKGELPSGQSLVVERAGGVVNGMKMVVDADGGDFETGNDYVLFLKAQPDTGYYYQVNDEGRYHVDSHGTLHRAAGNGAVTAAIEGKSIAELRSFVRDALRSERRPQTR